MKTIYIDLDNTICQPIRGSKYPEDCLKVTPFKTIIASINKLKERGNKIVFWTCRRENCRENTEQWLKENKILYDELIMEKPHYDMIIDDRAFSSLRSFWSAELIEIFCDWFDEKIQERLYSPDKVEEKE